MYKIETHLHTSEGSKCGAASGREQADARFAEGYSTIFVTDHFFRGNTRPDRRLPWKDYINEFCSGYEHAKERGDEIGLNVLFGFEDNFHGAEFLIYGIDKNWLLAHPEMIQWTPWEEYAKVHEAGGFMVQAHPYREAPYLFGISLYPKYCDAVEVINASQTKAMNDRAKWYAEQYHLPVTAGSDIHSVIPIGGGMLVPEEITTTEQYIELIRSGKQNYELIDVNRPEW